MRYAEAKVKERQELAVYRIFVTDALNNIPQQRFSKLRYADIISGRGITKDTRTGDEIAADVIKNLQLKVVEK